MAGKRIDFRAVILAGGSGERFWPLSTPELPKQFLSVFRGESLVRQAVARVRELAEPEDVFVVTGKHLLPATRRELPEVPRRNMFGEPMRRDTGAAVALGVGIAAREDCVLGFFPADQLVTDVKAFRRALRTAVQMAAKIDTVVLLGIKPEYPATGYGYVDPKSGKFHEKPSEAKARKYLKSGYLWNAGMFLARASVFRKAFAEHAPDLSRLAEPSAKGRCLSLEDIYNSIPRISFDFAVMEKLPRVEVVPVDCGWDDVGGYGAFDRYFPHDSHGNVREGPCTLVDSDNNICVARSARISLLGVRNLVVVTTPQSVLVVDKSRVADMKKLFEKR